MLGTVVIQPPAPIVSRINCSALTHTYSMHRTYILLLINNQPGQDKMLQTDSEIAGSYHPNVGIHSGRVWVFLLCRPILQLTNHHLVLLELYSSVNIKLLAEGGIGHLSDSDGCCFLGIPIMLEAAFTPFSSHLRLHRSIPTCSYSGITDLSCRFVPQLCLLIGFLLTVV